MSGGGRTWWRRRRVSLVLLVPLLAAFAWTASETAREGWWRVENHLPVPPGDDGWARVHDTDLRLDLLEEVPRLVDDISGDVWVPQAGYTLWRVAVEARSDATDVRWCDIRVVDDAGRSFGPADTAVRVPVFQIGQVECGGPGDDEPDDGAGEDSGAADGTIRSEALVLMPATATPVEVRISTSWTSEGQFGPRYAALPAP